MDSEELHANLDCVQTVLSMIVWTRKPEDQQDIIQGLQELTKVQDHVFRHSDEPFDTIKYRTKFGSA